MTRILDVRQKILKRNDEAARSLRGDFERKRVFVCDLVSSPGAGKTELLTATLRHLQQRGWNCAAVVGDLATNHDAERLATSGVPVRQIVTGTVCHLEAEMIATSIQEWDLSTLDALFIENVGNLVCPASWDLGEDQRVLLFPVTEGEDKPLKYPTLINTADLVVINKTDLADAIQFNRALAHENVRRARPDLEVMELSVRSGSGLDTWLDWLTRKIAKKSGRSPQSGATREIKRDANAQQPNRERCDSVPEETFACRSAKAMQKH